MTYLQSGPVATGATSVSSRQITMPLGVTTSQTVLIVACGSITAPGTVTAAKTGATFSAYNSAGSWGTATANSVGQTPITTANQWAAAWKATGLQAGDVVTITGTAIYEVHHQYFTGDLPQISAYWPRPGSQLTTVAPALAISAGQRCYAYFLTRSASAALQTPVVNASGFTTTIDYTSVDGSTQPVMNVAMAHFDPTGTTSDATTATYTGTATGNGAAFTFAEAVTVAPAAFTAGATLTGGGSAPAAFTAGATLTAGGTAAIPVLVSSRVGGVTTTGFKANADTTGTTAGRLAVSTSAGMTSPVYNSGSRTAVDSQSCLTLPITGLTPDTDYWWQFELDGVLTGPVGMAHTLPAGTTAGHYSIIVTSCAATGSNAVSFDNARQRTNPITGKRALLNFHTGDLEYANISSVHPGAQSLALNMTAFRGVFAQSRQSQLYREIPTEFMESDHDFGQDQAAGSDGNGAYYYQAYRHMLSACYPMVPDTNGDVTISGELGNYRTVTIGQSCYIITDGRGYMSDTMATDNSSKTKLGPTQKAWLKSTSLAAANANKVVIWIHEDGWNNSNTFTNDDTWAAYNTERTELANYFTANGIASRMYYIHGDWHLLAADNGSNNTWGGFPLVCAAPWDQNTGKTGTGAVFSQGQYPSPSGARMQMYGWFDIDDVPGSVTITFTGYDATTGTDTAAMTMTTVFNTAAGAALTAGAALAATGKPAVTGGATFGAGVTLTTTAAPSAGNAAALAVGATLATSGQPTATSTPALATGAALTASGSPQDTAGAALGAAAALSTSGTPSALASPALTTGATLATSGAASTSGPAAFAPSAVLSASGTGAQPGAANLAAGTTLTVSTSPATGSSAALTTAVTLTTGGKPGTGSSLTITTGAALTTTGVPSPTGPGSFTAGVTVTTTGSSTSASPATFTASTTLSAAGGGGGSQPVGLAPGATLTVTGRPASRAVPVLTAAAVLTVTGSTGQRTIVAKAGPVTLAYATGPAAAFPNPTGPITLAYATGPATI